MPPTDIDELFAQTLRGSYDDDAPWEAVHSLRRWEHGQVFETAVRWVESPEPLMRARGLDVLAQIGRTAQHETNSFPEESYAIVSGVLQRECELQPLNSAVSALGHLDDARAIPTIAGFETIPRLRSDSALPAHSDQFLTILSASRPCSTDGRYR